MSQWPGLSPASWAPHERARLEALEVATWPPEARTIHGQSASISATLSPIAVRAGIEALKAGGTAADAAIAVAMTQVVTIAGAVVSFAGVLQALYFDAASGHVSCLDADWNTYREEVDRTTIPPVNVGVITGAADVPVDHSSDGRRTLVPGFMAGLGALSRRFGLLPFKDLVQPALWYAENGVLVGSSLASYFDRRREVFTRTEAGRQFLAGAASDCPGTGDRFRQPELAVLLKAIARHGPGEMYSGAWAEAFVATVREAGGNASHVDLAGYRARWKQPASTEFAGATVFGPPAENPLSYSALLALNLLNATGVAEGGRYWRDPETFIRYVRALRFGQVGRYLPSVGAFERTHRLVRKPKDRLAPDYARTIAPHIDTLLSGQANPPLAGSHSQSVVVVDRFGNVAAMVHTHNSILWNETGLVVQGVPLPEPTAVNQTRFSIDPPGGRVSGSMAPMIALRGGRPAAAVASIGSSLMGETVRLMAGLLAGDSDLVALAEAPPFLLDLGPFAASSGLADRPEPVPHGGYDENFLTAARALGLALRAEPAQRVANIRGTAAFAAIDAAGASVTETPALFVYAGTDAAWAPTGEGVR
jgi:gamma-glutamyltranspeptidase/glutathione hydrolase